MTKDEWKKKLKEDGLTDSEIEGGISDVMYERAQCKISFTKPEDILFGGLNNKDMDELLDYMIPERLPDGTTFFSYKKTAERLKFAKKFNEAIDKHKNKSPNYPKENCA